MVINKKEFNQTILSYKGPININVTSFFSNYLKLLIQNDYIIINKIYKVFIELIQNVSYYSAQKADVSNYRECGIGRFEVTQDDDFYYIKTSNVIKKEDGSKLEKYCNEINNLDLFDLRQLKRKVRAQSNNRDIGAHIGLIHIGIVTRNNLQVKIEDFDEEQTFYNIMARVNRNFNELNITSPKILIA